MLLVDLVLLGSALPAASTTSKLGAWIFQPVSCSHRKEGDSVVLLFSGMINLVGVIGFVL